MIHSGKCIGFGSHSMNASNRKGMLLPRSTYCDDMSKHGGFGFWHHVHANRARALFSAPPPSLFNVPVYSRSLHTYRQNAPNMVTKSMAFYWRHFKTPQVSCTFHVISFIPCQIRREHDARCIEFRSLTLKLFHDSKTVL